MPTFSRRTFLKLAGQLTVGMGLCESLTPRVANGLENLAASRPPVIWLQAQSCTGCSVSLLNTHSPNVPQLLTDYIRMLFHPDLGAATGAVAMTALNKAIEQGGYFLVVEGSVPRAMPGACLIGGEPAYRVIERAAVNAKAGVALGTCAAYGGVPAADGNPTGAVSAASFLKRRGPALPVISLPGCPMHPDWFVGALVHTLEFGVPELDAQGCPVMYYGKTIHEQCPRFADYAMERFAVNFSDDGCLLKLGCLGPITKADCPVRQWNSGTNVCLRAGAPCIGCADKNFATRKKIPFYTVAGSGASPRAAMINYWRGQGKAPAKQPAAPPPPD